MAFCAPQKIQTLDFRSRSVVAIRVDDVAFNGHAIARACVRQRKTGRPVRFELTEQTRQAINEYLGASGRKVGDYLFDGRRPGQSMTTRQYAPLLSERLTAIGLDPRVYDTHSLRRTKATLIYRRTGNLLWSNFYWAIARSRALCSISVSR